MSASNLVYTDNASSVLVSAPNQRPQASGVFRICPFAAVNMLTALDATFF
jgi:hypothetical protein